MKPFIFKLAAVLKLRDFEKQEAYDAYKTAISIRKSLEQACRDMSARLKSVQAEIAGMRESLFPASTQQHFFGSLQDIENQLQNLLRELSEAEVVEQHKLDEFLEAKTKVDMLEKLKEKRFKMHFKEELYREEKELDDLVNSRYQPIAI